MHLLNLSIPICDLALNRHSSEDKENKLYQAAISTQQKIQCSPAKFKSPRKEIDINRPSPSYEMKLRKRKQRQFSEFQPEDIKGQKDPDFKLSDLSESDSEEEKPLRPAKCHTDDEGSFEIHKVGVSKSKKREKLGSKKIEKETPENSPKKLSDYEKMVERNRAEKLAFLQAIKMDEIKAGFAEAFDTLKEKKKKPQPVKRTYKQVEKSSPPVLRKSRRLAKMDVDLSEEALFLKSLKEAQESQAEAAEVQKQKGSKKVHKHFSHKVRIERNWWKLKEISIPPEMTFEQALQFEELYESYKKDVNIPPSENAIESKKENSFLYDRSVLKNLTLDENNIAKVTPDRITQVAWYPSADHLIVTVGSKYGYLGIWNVKSDSSPYLFKIHDGGITCLKFNPYNPVQMLTSSYDGILRWGDLSKNIFEQVCDSKFSFTYFDFLSSNTYLVSQYNGEVAIVDNRTRGKYCEKTHSCHDYSIKTVDIHPVDKNYFVSADKRGTIRLWDLRKLQKKPVADITHHKRCVNSAFFSRCTGNSILATSADDTISLFDSTRLTSDIKLKALLKHNNFTGRWLTVFRSTWLPNSDEAFVVGSMKDPRRIEVFDKNMNEYYTIMHPNLTTISSTNAFHPCVPALAGGNSSGKVFVFTSE